jgi:hypothetical protein
MKEGNTKIIAQFKKFGPQNESLLTLPSKAEKYGYIYILLSLK